MGQLTCLNFDFLQGLFNTRRQLDASTNSAKKVCRQEVHVREEGTCPGEAGPQNEGLQAGGGD